MSANDIYSIIILSMILLLIFLVEVLGERGISFLSIFNYTYALFFGVVPIIIIINPDLLQYGVSANWSYHFNAYNNQLLPAVIYAFIFYLFFILSYLLLSDKRFISYDIEKRVDYIRGDVLSKFGILFLVFGIISLFIYSNTMGGPINAIKYAQLARSGVYEHTGVYTFFKHFIKSVYFGLFIFITTYLEENVCKFKSIFFIIISTIFTIIALFVYSGRGNIVILLVTILFYQNIINNKLFMNRRQVLRYIFFILIFGTISTFYRPFMLMLSGREIIFDTSNIFMQMYVSIIKGFSVPIISLMVALEKFSFAEIRMGAGFLQIFVDIIPKSIVDVSNVYTINNLNTELFGYILDSRMYNINSGLLAYFYYEFHWFGIIIGSSITALVIKFYDDCLRYLKSNKTIAIIIIYFLFNVPNRVLAGDQVGGIKSFLILYLGLFLMLLYIKRMELPTRK